MPIRVRGATQRPLDRPYTLLVTIATFDPKGSAVWRSNRLTRENIHMPGSLLAFKIRAFDLRPTAYVVARTNTVRQHCFDLGEKVF